MIRWDKIERLEETGPDPRLWRANARNGSGQIPGPVGPSRAGKMVPEQSLEAAARKNSRPPWRWPRRPRAFGKGSLAREGEAWCLRPRRETAGEADRGKPEEMLRLSDWCREHSLPDDEWRLLAEILSRDGRNKEAIRRMKDRVRSRKPLTDLAPPLAGRWKAWEDKTRHHQEKVWAIYAIDYVHPGIEVPGAAKLKLEEFPGFGAPVYACADGVVTGAQDGFEDLPIGKAGAYGESNSILIRHPLGNTRSMRTSEEPARPARRRR